MGDDEEQAHGPIVLRPRTAGTSSTMSAWYRVAGAAFLVLGVLRLAFDREPLALIWVALGLSWWLMPQLSRWESRRVIRVDDAGVSWPRAFGRRWVPLSEIAAVRTDAENPRWATQVVLTLADGRTRRVPSAEPAQLAEAIGSRIAPRSPG